MGKVYIMRGLPGCGKTTRAKELVEKGVILSTDDFFMIGEQYRCQSCHLWGWTPSTGDLTCSYPGGHEGPCSFQVPRLAELLAHFDPLLILDAHQWNQKRFRGALELGISPIVVDNTNILHVHMDPYIDLAQQYGYDIEVVPISTNMSDEQLAIRNVHGVPLNVIRRMRELYQP